MIQTVGNMNLMGITPSTASANSAASAAQIEAQSVQFDTMLKELQNKVEAAALEKAGEAPAEALPKGAASTVTAEEKARAQLEKRLKDACEGFESMLLSIMYKEMRNTVPKNQLFGDDNAHEIWQSMLDTAMMEEAAKSGGIGLADLLYKQLAPQVLAGTVAPPEAASSAKP